MALRDDALTCGPNPVNILCFRFIAPLGLKQYPRNSNCVLGYEPLPRLFAFAFTVNVRVVGEEVAVPDVEEGVSQFGTLDIE
jgi:hypothetical protein